MSTRATYKFTSDNASTTYYIHYDGYLEGAAVYFRNMLTYENKRGGFACQFVRANDLAEITGGHDSHGDTEYAYTLSAKGELKAFDVKHDWERETATYKPIFSGDVVDFVNEYCPEEPTLYRVGGEVVTAEEGEKILMERVNEMWKWKGRGMTGNASSILSEIIRLIKHVRPSLPAFGLHAETFCRQIALEFGKAYGWEKPEQFETRFIDDELNKAA